MWSWEPAEGAVLADEGVGGCEIEVRRSAAGTSCEERRLSLRRRGSCVGACACSV